MSHYKPYPAYRDSGIEWLGQVPEHWATLRLANIGPLEKGNGGTKEDDADNGMPCVRYGDLYTTYDFLIRKVRKFIRPERACDYTPIKYGDLLFAASGETFEEIGKSAVNLTESIACCGGDVIVLRPEREVNPVFLAYAAGSISAQAQKSLMGKGFTVIHIYGNALRDLVIATPTAREQELIGVAIERECARIDTLIAKKNRFIELLKEKRQALITHAVTKGLNPDVKMKESGVDWIGEVPEHWVAMKLNHVARVTEGLVDPKAPPYRDMILIAPNHIESGTGKILGLETAVLQNAESGKYTCKKGAVIYSKIRPALAKVAIAPCDCLCSADMYPMDCTDRTYPEWLFYLMLSPPFTSWAILESNRVAMPKINRESLADLRVFLPPMDEQLAVVAWLNAQLEKLEKVSEKTQRSIDLLKERRSAFISAAVTGQIDLREAA